ncbi:hypothetical protein EKN06_12350 [Croceicoccus ponticola]|uniref:Uncharacterized protein n=1 Tax=Croceicoccus ponticola TaxID=2217664 RepID=A0A437GVF3_9SPHN|nr:hypothetical protein [Croceicoccus ponticola]RVQ65719.1 hypothetical protein EKN06_12350 [Croceicoccus ponticola]
MNLTLGEILAAALAPDPSSIEAALEERAQYCAGVELSRQIAPLLRESEERTFDALTCVPDSELAMLRSPEGWAVLASLVAADLGVPNFTYQPTRH